MTTPPARPPDLIPATPVTAAPAALPVHQKKHGSLVGRRRVGGCAAHAFKPSVLRGMRKCVERVGGKTRAPYVHDHARSGSPKENDGLSRRFHSRCAHARARDSLTARNKNSLENRTRVRSPAFTVRDQWASSLTDPPQRRPPFHYSRIFSGFKDNMLSAIWARRCDTPHARRFHPPTPQISSAPVPASLRAPCNRRCLRP
jgi:hypothetical protein